VVGYNTRYLQLQPAHRQYGPTQAKAMVCEWEDGRVEVHYRGERIAFRELPGAPVGAGIEERINAEGVSAGASKPDHQQGRWKPAPNHPWRQYKQTSSRNSALVAPPPVELPPSASP